MWSSVRRGLLFIRLSVGHPFPKAMHGTTLSLWEGMVFIPTSTSHRVFRIAPVMTGLHKLLSAVIIFHVTFLLGTMARHAPLVMLSSLFLWHVVMVI